MVTRETETRETVARVKDQARAIALFFLFALMDEKVALEAANKTIAQLKAAKGRGYSGVSSPDAPDGQLADQNELVNALTKGYEHYRGQVPRNRPTMAPTDVWRFDASSSSVTNLDSWRKFQKEATEGEVVAVILSKILGFDDETIASGIGVSIGTARYRVGKGIRHLGQIANQPQTAKKA